MKNINGDNMYEYTTSAFLVPPPEGCGQELKRIKHNNTSFPSN
jgi:hypothetical protein